ncbi:MAG: PIN domain-containing protein [Clostridium sp.]|nr:PIN domain-containing protein [Clostridium sp.]MCM1460552.1 PIN domain-containing protein [Bacteroides sp.]
MTYYLIDYENVKVNGLNGLSKLVETDNVCIFYSENADTLTFGLHKRLNEAKANITYQKVEVGTSNALDFQLCTYLGYLIAENKNESLQNYYIVSKDKGYSSVVNYWEKRKVNITQAVDCSGKKELEAKKELLMEVENLIGDKNLAPTIVKFIEQYKTKQGINTAISKELKDSKKTSEIYNAIKPLIADKKGR